ncbi:MAG: bifunctional response regulator/alkaline phosphatase family protein [Bacteroidota bacterium]
MPRILWADDEIDLLKPHILFLEAKGYDVTSVANGADAVAKNEQERYDVVFLDEQMPGMGGLDALQEIKANRPEVPVVMITKSEEEQIMEDALGRQIADYLIKPVNPKQILLTIKRLLDRERLRGETVSQDYLSRFGQITMRLSGGLDHAEWVDLYQELVRFDLDLGDADENVAEILHNQYREANREFGNFVERYYADWIGEADTLHRDGDDRPALSHEVLSKYVLPHLEPHSKGRGGDGKPKRPVLFFLIDCLRFDQWLMLESLLYPHFEIQKDWHWSLLPTATPYSRNAIFSGLLPINIAQRHRDRWSAGDDDESLNQHEEFFLGDLLKRRRLGDIRMRYDKLITGADGQAFADKVLDYTQHDLSAVVVNFLDILTHSRSDSAVLKEIAPDEAAFRGLARTWFEHSWLFEAFRTLAEQDVTIVLTTDHGAVRSLRPTKVIGDRDTSTSLRYKFGRNLKCDRSDAIFVKHPENYGLPRSGLNENYIFCKEDFYFVYPTSYHRYVQRYNDSFQHGGVSMEEMLLPVVTLRPKG